MKKTFKIEELCCANCARKMEEAIGKLPGVTSATVVFMTQKLILEAEDENFADIVKQADKCIRKIEPDCRLV